MISKEQAYKIVEELVIRFEEQIESYKQADYNETLTRRDFIDPFFKALGWDVDNSQGFAEAYREVIHEDRVKVGKATKAPDYSFRLSGGKRLFFVEAKKPSVSIKDDISVAYQIRRYGWSAKLPVSIITDFEEFAVYDCTKKPKPTDKSSTARIKYINYKDYLTEFDFLWDTFSKEKVLKGSFDKYIQSDTAKKGTATVDNDFLESLDKWRTYLATSISLRNKDLDEEELNYVVQLLIDRLIFLRIAEDRGVENYGQLKNSVNQKGESYQNLFFNFKQADEKYNSGLFDFKKDVISEKITIDNKVIKTIVNEMYYPESPYEFSVISVEILGSAYEQFLGKQIRITSGHRAKIEEKPEVRKAGGVYYTPQYVVDYIVEKTVGQLINGKTPKQIKNIRIVDPACGSGSFLIGAYQFLLEYHKNYYTEKGTKIGKKDSPITPSGELTSSEKKKILLNNIYGVDIDVNAVEVTKLSLLLKCMEGETATTIAQQQKLWHERLLPTLDDNIKSGNSLIDLDFYDAVIDFGEEKKVKPFNWQKAYPEVFKDGGFDAVIGNPPYGATFSESELSYFKTRYNTSVWRGESYLLFIEKGLVLLKQKGLLGYIIPDTLLNLGFSGSTRKYILQNSLLSELVLLPSNVFSGATVDTIILLTQKSQQKEPFHKSDVSVKAFNKRSTISSIDNPERSFTVNTAVWQKQDAFNLQSDSQELELLEKIESGQKKISDIAEMFSGIKAYEVGKGTPPQTNIIRDEKPFTSSNQESTDWKPFFDGKHIGRYELLWNYNNWIKYGRWLAAPRNPENFEGEKILIRKITGKTLISTYIPDTSYCNTLLFILKITDKSYSYPALTGILNSSLIGWYFRKKFQISDDDTFPQIMIRDILEFPIPDLNEKNNEELGGLVNQIIKLNEELKNQKLPHRIEQLKLQIEHIDSRIDKFVYSIFNVSEKEIITIENSISKP
ncbi:Eco57I restriction-modification methylase domain-containing protein [Perlabentimonas gracilis]|uniref:Eco57I restriction-modification methylase domain-containing protein n=1 Tax=Perlabentimonas gracilis TaxID=2715279 RepID=UPI00140A60F8|nr:N-6 DNA methylase [Perlabentimonas gracilis]NHB70382.1 N-6 DNA methylase [Perlabentimonas gracilis]